MRKKESFSLSFYSFYYKNPSFILLFLCKGWFQGAKFGDIVGTSSKTSSFSQNPFLSAYCFFLPLRSHVSFIISSPTFYKGK